MTVRWIGMLASLALAVPSVGQAQQEPGTEEPVEIEDRFVELEDLRIHLLQAGPAQAPAVLLLHGGRFHSGTWKETGTIERLARAGFRVVAVDLPGFGRTSAGPPERRFQLVELVDALELERVFVLSPSMSGRFALPFVTTHPDRVLGFVAVAPVGIGEHGEALARFSRPTLLLWGEKDTVVPLSEADELQRRVAGSRRVVLAGASHPCYLDRPDEFHAALVEFLEEVAAASAGRSEGGSSKDGG